MINKFLVWYFNKFGRNDYMFRGFFPNGTEWVVFCIGKYRIKRCLDSRVEQKRCEERYRGSW